MLEIPVPGFPEIKLTDLVLDFNGTLALDGELIAGVAGRLKKLSKKLKIHILTSDTFGNAAKGAADLPGKLFVLGPGDQAQAKWDYVKEIGPVGVVAIGNGRNDRLMLEGSVLGIAVIQSEGAGVETLTSADVVIPSILDALDLLSNPQRLVATLRS
jgi:soluble P-type ATPase